MGRMNELEALLEKLKKNEEKLGKDLLKRKYKKNYMKLKKEIAGTASSAFAGLAAAGLYIREGDQPALDMIMATFRDILAKEKEAGLSRKLGDIVLARKDLDAFAVEAMRVRAELINSGTYRMYWLSHCRMSDKGCYNDLIEAWWCDGIWSKNGKEFINAPPADSAGFDRMYAEEMEAYGKLTKAA